MASKRRAERRAQIKRNQRRKKKARKVARHPAWSDVTVDPDIARKLGICRLCQRPVRPPRRTWCSDRCTTKARVMTSATAARGVVEHRDGGVCALCGMPAEAIRRQILSFLKAGYGSGPKGEVGALLASLFGVTRREWWASGAWWQADHIVPVAEGGGGCGLENLRTLCTECHRQETAALNARLAAKRSA